MFMIICFAEIPEINDVPVISGGLQSYQFGDQLMLNCTSPRTYPPTVLRWFINDQVVIRSVQIASICVQHLIIVGASSPLPAIPTEKGCKVRLVQVHHRP